MDDSDVSCSTISKFKIPCRSTKSPFPYRFAEVDPLFVCLSIDFVRGSSPCQPPSRYRTRLPRRRFLVSRPLRALFHSYLCCMVLLRTTSGTIEIIPPKELLHIFVPTDSITALQEHSIKIKGINSTVGSLELLRGKSLQRT